MDTATIKLLLEHGFAVDQDTLCIAAETGNLDIFRYLAESCIGLLFWDEDSEALYIATVSGHTGMVQYLIRERIQTQSILILAMPSSRMLVRMVILR